MLRSLRRLMLRPSLPTLLARGDLHRALDAVDHALSLQPDEPVLLDQRAKLLLRLHRHGEAGALLLRQADYWGGRGFGQRAMDSLDLAETLSNPPEGILCRRRRFAPLVHLDAVGALPIFDKISRDKLIGLVSGMDLRRYETGVELVTQGDPGEEMFVVAQGAIEVRHEAPSGMVRVLDRCCGPGFFGEDAMVARVPRMTTIIAQTPLTALVIDQPRYDELATSWPGIHQVLQQTSSRRRALTEASP